MRAFEAMWSETWGLPIMLGLLTVLIFILSPLAPQGMGSPALATVYSLLLLSGVATLGGTRPFRGKVAATLAIGWVVVEILLIARPTFTTLISEAVVAILALYFLQFAILAQVFRGGQLNAHRIEGAVAAYLLIGLGWAWAYRLLLLIQPAAFAPSASPATGQDLNVGTNLIYFSFTTLTTVGYGDIVPVGPFARSLANFESVIGQLYPAILIGRLVSLKIGEQPLVKP